MPLHSRISVGDLWRMVRHPENVYILSVVGNTTYRRDNSRLLRHKISLVSLNSGTIPFPSIKVDDPHNITQFEFYNIVGQEDIEKVTAPLTINNNDENVVLSSPITMATCSIIYRGAPFTNNIISPQTAEYLIRTKHDNYESAKNMLFEISRTSLISAHPLHNEISDKSKYAAIMDKWGRILAKTEVTETQNGNSWRINIDIKEISENITLHMEDVRNNRSAENPDIQPEEPVRNITIIQRSSRRKGN